MNRQRIVHLALLLVFLAQLGLPAAGSAAPLSQVPTPEQRAAALLEEMTPEERVGQLFLVEFDGPTVEEGSPIFNLITTHHVGGVVLKAENNNFTGEGTTLEDLLQLTQGLQSAEWISSQAQHFDPFTNEPFSPNFIPLFIGLSQNGNGPQGDQILSGVTTLPSQMAVGATWNPDLAFQVGEVLGNELEILGINLLFGPILDVAESPRPERAGDLGVASYSGSPFWVGQMGQAFIAGVHQGSSSRIMLVGQHFPGLSGADRPPEEEIPTVRKTLEQLMQVELGPFFSVTGLAPNPEYAVDALLLAHAKYEGFQGNIRPSTRPISFDPQAVEQLMAIEPFLAWREGGGLLISDELGTRAIRRFEDPAEGIFNARLVALNAFLAGNDLINLGDFYTNQDPDTFTTILRTLDFFALKYREDLAFAQNVDQSVLRILTMKFKLYESFRLDNIIIAQERVQFVGASSEVSFEIARQAATLFSPAPSDLDTVLPASPALSDRIVIISDTYTTRQCEECPEIQMLDPEALQQVVVRLYGPEAGGRIVRQNLLSYTFADLLEMLDTPSSGNRLQSDIRGAEWVIFLMLDESTDRPSSLALRRFLSERPDLIQQKKSIVFALNAPYYLDATDISNITAYYGLYSSQPEFLEVAARLLFKEITAPGASPVSVSGVGYDLTTALSPNPELSFNLSISHSGADLPQETPTPDPEAEPVPTPSIEYGTGDPVLVKTGMILDQNGHPVPDGTAVQFILTSTTPEGGASQREISAETSGGSAQATFVLDTPGTLTIQASCGDPPALSSIVSIDVINQGDGGGIVVVVTETPAPQEPLLPFFPTPIPGIDEMSNPLQAGVISAWHWVLLVLVTVFVSLFSYQIGAAAGMVRWGVRWALTSFIGGTLTTTYMAFGFSGSARYIQAFGLWGIVVAVTLGTLAGWGAGWVWQWITRR